MKLYFSPGSCGLASQIVLREAEQQFDLIAVDFKTKTTVEGDYFQVTPKGLVPALALDDGEVITENAIILQWIADQHPERHLLPPAGTRERRRALEWLNYVATDLHKGFAAMFSPFLDATSKAKFAEGNLASRFAYVDSHLRSHEYVLGARISVVDAYLFNVLSWAPHVHIDLKGYEGIQRFMTAMRQQPSVRASLAAESRAA